jgi:hypothetical protein
MNYLAAGYQGEADMGMPVLPSVRRGNISFVPPMKSNPGNAVNLSPGSGKIMNFMAIALHAEIRLRNLERELPFFFGKE